MMKISLILFCLVVLLLIVVSLRERIRWQQMRDKNWDAIGEAKSSPLSQAIVSLVGTAGGIYLSLVLVQTFLEFEIPRYMYIGGFALEPLATISIALAIVQPFVNRLWLRKKYH